MAHKLPARGRPAAEVLALTPRLNPAVRGLTSAWGEGTFERDATDRVVSAQDAFIAAAEALARVMGS
mgnify:CR=1 FL=1